ncbi:unnamed protein product [Notodromas monacha]|uniref:Uncharacterized protein n=1 Tax=Notodromas monacha TaxID=399045 RepID=A0A7R9BK20_9CRUS|nr:unnamed protein product [Notodromas monacha]CAG0915590.1 unnamed protein product [Notodromas monacha]
MERPLFCLMVVVLAIQIVLGDKLSLEIPVPVPLSPKGSPTSDESRLICHKSSNLRNRTTWSECDETRWGLSQSCACGDGESLCVSAVDLARHTVAKGCMSKDALRSLQLRGQNQADFCRVSKRYPTQLYCTCSTNGCNRDLLLSERMCYHCWNCDDRNMKLRHCFSGFVLSKGMSGAGHVYCVKEIDYTRDGQINRFCEPLDTPPNAGCVYEGSTLKCYCTDDACNQGVVGVMAPGWLLMASLLSLRIIL